MKELNSRLHSRFSSVKPYSLRSFFRLAVDVMLRGVGSYPRREKAERLARERADTQPGLVRGVSCRCSACCRAAVLWSSPALLLQHKRTCPIRLIDLVSLAGSL
jgi:hypothetical protein